MENYQILPIRVRVDLHILAMERFFRISRDTELENNQHIEFSLKPGVYLYELGVTARKGIESAFSKTLSREQTLVQSRYFIYQPRNSLDSKEL